MSSFQPKYLASLACTAISLYLLLEGIPNQLPVSFKQEQTAATPGTEPETIIQVEAVPFVSEAILIKKSGDDPLLPDENDEFDSALRTELKRRFGIDEEVFEEPPEKIHHPFDTPPSLKERVHFWIQVFSRYGKGQYIFHDRDDPAIVYSVIDLSFLDPDVSGLDPFDADRLKQRAFSDEKNRIVSALKDLSQKISKNRALSIEEQRLAKFFIRKEAPLLHRAANPDQIRIQSGFAHRFKRAIELSGLYMEEMEAIFSSKGLPIELTRLPLIESAFDTKARSSASAVGLWQFIPETGQRYLKIDAFVDERLDPIMATYAAADHLKKEYHLLGSWPLTINAYNTGPGRMFKAKKQLQTDDIGLIIKYFKDAGYQFYSKNYFPEFLAALHIYENQERYFGPIEKLPPFHYEWFASNFSINVEALAERTGLDKETMADLNPSLKKNVLEGKQLLPPGYLLRIPQKMAPQFAMAVKAQLRELELARWHIVSEGDTLVSLSKIYRVPLETLEKLNPYLPQESLSSGTVLQLPPQATGVAFTNEDEIP